jgi:histidine triad (HIT) family protein
MATDPSCIFCRIALGDLPAKVVHRTERVVAFEDLNPAAPCHVLVIPNEHIRTVNDIAPEHHALMGELFAAAKEVAALKGCVDGGYRLVMNCGEAAGQSVWHIHLHVLAGRDLEWPPG